FAEAQIETCGLDLVGDEIIGAQDGTLAHQRRDQMVGQNAFFVDWQGERQVRKLPGEPFTNLRSFPRKRGSRRSLNSGSPLSRGRAAWAGARLHRNGLNAGLEVPTRRPA